MCFFCNRLFFRGIHRQRRSTSHFLWFLAMRSTQLMCPQITPCNPSVTCPVGHKEQYDMLTRISDYLHSAMGRLNFSIVTLDEPEKNIYQFSDSWQRGVLTWCGSCSWPQITPCNLSVTHSCRSWSQYDMSTKTSATGILSWVDWTLALLTWTSFSLFELIWMYSVYRTS